MRLIAPILLVACGVAAAVAAQTPPPGPGPVMQPLRRMQAPAVPPAFTGSVARLPMILVDGIPVVNVSLGGRDFRFALDTGAGGHGRIRPAVAEALRLAVVGRVRAGDSSGAEQERRTFAIDGLGVGGVTFTGVQLSEMVAPPGRLEGVDGILGLGLFARHLLTIDYGRGEVVLSRASLPRNALAYQLSPAGITVPLRIGDLDVPARIDTGNAVAALMVPAAVAERLPRAGTARQVAVARTAMSSVEIWEAPINVPVRMGRTRLPIASVRYPALGDAANLGSPAFANGVLRIDQVNQRIEVEIGRRRRN